MRNYLILSLLMVVSQSHGSVLIEDEFGAPDFVSNTNQFNPAKIAPESLLAHADASGSWGAALQGFQLSVSVGKSVFTNGEPVLAHVLLRNVGSRPGYYYFAVPVDDGLRFDLKKDAQLIFPRDAITTNTLIEERLKPIQNGKSIMAMLPVGTDRGFVVDLAKSFDLGTNGQFTVQAHRWVWNSDRTVRTNVFSGTAQFSITNSP